ncbi:hypothetical protein M8494_16575 [Serratia ureilytica]
MGEVILVTTCRRRWSAWPGEAVDVRQQQDAERVWVPYRHHGQPADGQQLFRLDHRAHPAATTTRKRNSSFRACWRCATARRTSSPITWTAWCKPREKPPARCSCS